MAKIMGGGNMKKGIKLLAFDAYGTLFDVHSVISLCDELFPNQGTNLSQIWRAKQLEYTWLRSLMRYYEDFWQVTESALIFACNSLKLQCEPATRAKLMDAYLNLKTFPEVHQALGDLSQYSLAILSNGSPRMLQAAVESAGLKEIFAHVISVDELKIYKPSPRVYQLASHQTGVNKSAIGFVSSNSWDIIGAKAFGFWTCWVNRFGAPADELGFTPDVTASNLTNLVDTLRH